MMKHCTNYGEPVVNTVKFYQKCSTKVLPLISLIPLVEHDNNEDDLVYCYGPVPDRNGQSARTVTGS
jgi:hypothetical protein